MQIPVFTHASRKAIGRWALYLAIFSFLVHLLMHLFRSYIPGGMEAALLKDPISAIYTPFSILLVYEAYLMIYYLRRSTTIYIAKQYEVISLILIRGLFKDMAALDLKIATGAVNTILNLRQILYSSCWRFTSYIGFTG